LISFAFNFNLRRYTKAATENGSRNVAAVKSSTTATDSLLELIWVGRCRLTQ
jgi:hypothetical protein